MRFSAHYRGMWVFRAAIAGLLLSCLPGQAQVNDERFPYGIHGGTVVRIVRTEGTRLVVRQADGSETTLSKAAVSPIIYYPEAAKLAVDSAEAACKPVMDKVAAFRRRLQAEFNEAFVEVACVALIGRDGLPSGVTVVIQERRRQPPIGSKVDGVVVQAEPITIDVSGRTITVYNIQAVGDGSGHAVQMDVSSTTDAASTEVHIWKNKPILLEDREARLRELVTECRNYDFSSVEHGIAHCNFVLTFIDEAARHNERQAAALGREKTWQEAQAHAQTGDELQATRHGISDLEKRMQEYSRIADTVRGMRGSVTALSATLKSSFETEFLPVQQVATDLMRLYSDARSREAQGHDITALIDPISTFDEKWSGGWLDARIRPALGKPATALAELDRLRALPQAAKAQTAQPEKKDDGCFVATAVFGSYQHPDVITFRRFRDNTLETTAPGRAFIDWYYRTGPNMAAWLNDRPGLKPVVRLPLALSAFGLRHAGLVGGLVVLYYVEGLVSLYRRRNLKRKENHAAA